jgi:hypothetical protein
MRARVPLVASVALAALLSLTACKRLGVGGGCGSGETANADPPFCYKVPAGFTARGEPSRRAGWFSIGYADANKARVDFIARDLAGFDSAWKGLQSNPKNAKATDAKEEDIAGGKGKLLTYTTPEKDPRVVISVLVRGTKSTLECEAEYKTSAPRPDLLDVCKAIHEP